MGVVDRPLLTIVVMMVVVDSDAAPKSDIRIGRLHLSQAAAGNQTLTAIVKRETSVELKLITTDAGGIVNEQTGQPTAQRSSYHDRCQPALRC